MPQQRDDLANGFNFFLLFHALSQSPSSVIGQTNRVFIFNKSHCEIKTENIIYCTIQST